MRRRTLVITLVIALVAVVGVATFGVRQWLVGRCAAASSTIDVDRLDDPYRPVTGINVPSDDVLGSEFVDDALELGGPFGDPVSGWYDAEASGGPTVLSLGDGAMLASGSGFYGGDVEGVLTAVDLPDGAPRWAREFAGNAPGGGLVGDVFVTLGIPEDSAPVLAGYDPSTGDRVSCARLGRDVESEWDPTLLSARVDDDTLVAYRSDDPDDDDLRLTRVDPATGERRWTTTIDDVWSAQELDVVGDVAVLTRPRDGATRDGAVNALANPDRRTPDVVALSAADGRALWSFPRDVPDDTWISAAVVGVDEASGTIVVDTIRTTLPGWPPPEGTFPFEDVVTERAIVGLGPDGQQRWSRSFGDPETAGVGDVVTWDGMVVTLTPAEAEADREGATMRGFSAADGAEAWAVPVGHPGLRGADRVGEVWIAQDGDALDVIDPATGDVEELPLANAGLVYDVVATDAFLVLRWESGQLVYERADV